MYLEHEHIERNWYNDQADSPGDKVSHPESWRDSEIPQKQPKLVDGAEANRCDGEEADPFATQNGAQGQTSEDEPRPPGLGEWFVLIFV